MGQMQTVKCKKCNAEFEARSADINRGWGKFCSKSCKAKKQGRLLASKETQKMWREYNQETARRLQIACYDNGCGLHDGHGQE
jgi:endogenous inhibitor of DNA gyrase (YacG/DUF329 family)